MILMHRVGRPSFGLTSPSLRWLGLDLTPDGQVNVADVQALSRSQAVDIVVVHDYTSPNISRLPEVLHLSMSAIDRKRKLCASLQHKVGRVRGIKGDALD